MQITIDEEFKSLIPPLSDLERMQLEEILEKEGCRDPLITWNGILIDGHNRYEICERLGLEYSTKEIVLADRATVKQWMYRNQLGRRNLSPDVASELRGLMYNSRKKTVGRPSKLDQNDPIVSETTAESVAKETGVSAATIKRDGIYAEAVNVVAEIVPDIRQQVRKGKVKTQQVLAAAKVAKSSPEKAREIVTSGKPKKPAKSKPADPKMTFTSRAEKTHDIPLPASTRTTPMMTFTSQAADYSAYTDGAVALFGQADSSADDPENLDDFCQSLFDKMQHESAEQLCQWFMDKLGWKREKKWTQAK
jgi:hypothetical protein